MKTEELLNPRYRVIQDYPNNRIDVGTIIELNTGNDLRFQTDGVKGYYAYTENGAMTEYDFKRWPEIYHKLRWYEHRKDEDMPKYLKHIYNNEVTDVRLVVKYIKQHMPESIMGFEYSGTKFSKVSMDGWEPATEEEYLSFKEKLSK